MSGTAFSFDELQSAKTVELPDLESLTASDGVRLSYRRYIPITPRAVVLFYHGGGAHSGAGYQYLGNGLQNEFDVAVYMPDIRGHGASEGPDGDTPNPGQVWKDITTFLKHIHTEFPQLPLLLGGHSSGAGLVLNYASQPGHEAVDNYIFLSPEFGFRSKTARPSLATSFTTVKTFPFIINAMSGGLLSGHSHAVRFNYPAELLASNKSLVSSYTVNMANAITPFAPQKQIAKIDRAFGLWIGADDELINPVKVLAFADLAVSVRAASEVGIISKAKHLSILMDAHATIGPWIAQLIQRINNQRL